ncbi:MAG: efflux RND transporter periplasmic adaptor subunit [Myxococcales bacterium]|nr:efflux RND transporter periplasmic adaptor subunit [Myxococcales bacterium]
MAELAAPRPPTDPTADPAADVRRRLGLDGRGRWRRRLGALLVLATAAGGIAWAWQRGAAPPTPVRYRTAPVEPGIIAVQVVATGSLQPVRTVEVGAEISGRVVAVAVDANDRVTAGQVMARLDPEPLRTQLEQAEAQLAAARAARQQAKATQDEARLALARARTLTDRGLAAAQGLEQAVAAHARAKAAHASAQAQERLARAKVDQVRTDLEKAEIKAPIDGIVLTRSVEPGNAVAASLQTPVLFTVAEDLRRMRLELAVDEADVGRVATGQAAQFTVDAWPGLTFAGQVSSVRFAPTTSQNVVTYEVQVAVANPELRLRPGMTATAHITAQKVDDALRVPNAALRFTPPQAQAPRMGGPPGPPGLLGTGRPKRQSAGAAAKARPKGPQVWVLEDGAPRPVPVETGVTDGTWTQVTGGPLQAGQAVITGLDSAGADRTAGGPS